MIILNFILQHIEPDICHERDKFNSITYLSQNLAGFTCLGYCGAAHTPLEHNIHAIPVGCPFLVIVLLPWLPWLVAQLPLSL